MRFTLPTAFLSLLLVTGCNLKAGTLEGYAECVKDAKDKSLPLPSIDDHCREKHERPIPVEVEGSGSLIRNSEGRGFFNGRLIHHNKGYVVTQVEFVLSSNDGRVLFSGKTPFYRFQQNDSEWPFMFTVYDLKVQVTERDVEPGNWQWNIGKVYGMKIS